ncbi:hypothetical protein E4U43_001979 [Claviceps pusilla]|uniref:Thioredoxin domain-containing protein n=1 Tax=Claviceps pusilla TaxID=123648 RepID=A0A9P7SVK0_9HYPO|nr:hypothetical protein E4U43_001979 [Claviceps pusilla]
MLSCRLVASVLPAVRGWGARPVRPVWRGFHGSASRGVVHRVERLTRLQRTSIPSAEAFQKVVADHDAVIVDCFATWCGPCRAIGPILEKHSEDIAFKDKIHFVKFDVDQLPAVTQTLQVRAMPTFFFFKNGKKVDELVGANPNALLERLRRLAA